MTTAGNQNTYEIKLFGECLVVVRAAADLDEASIAENTGKLGRESRVEAVTRILNVVDRGVGQRRRNRRFGPRARRNAGLDSRGYRTGRGSHARANRARSSCVSVVLDRQIIGEGRRQMLGNRQPQANRTAGHRAGVVRVGARLPEYVETGRNPPSEDIRLGERNHVVARGTAAGDREPDCLTATEEIAL